MILVMAIVVSVIFEIQDDNVNIRVIKSEVIMRS